MCTTEHIEWRGNDYSRDKTSRSRWKLPAPLINNTRPRVWTYVKTVRPLRLNGRARPRSRIIIVLIARENPKARPAGVLFRFVLQCSLVNATRNRGHCNRRQRRNRRAPADILSINRPFERSIENSAGQKSFHRTRGKQNVFSNNSSDATRRQPGTFRWAQSPPIPNCSGYRRSVISSDRYKITSISCRLRGQCWRIGSRRLIILKGLLATFVEYLSFNKRG